MEPSPQQRDYREAIKRHEDALHRLGELRKFHGIDWDKENMDVEERIFLGRIDERCIRDAKCQESLDNLLGCEQELIHWAKGMISNMDIPKKIKDEMLSIFGLIKFPSMRHKVVLFCLQLNPILKEYPSTK